MFVEELALCRRILAMGGENPEALRDVAIALARGGEVLQEQERFAEAERMLLESVPIRRRLMGRAEEASPMALRDLSLGLEQLGEIRLSQGRTREAEQLFRESLGFGKRRLAEKMGAEVTTLWT